MSSGARLLDDAVDRGIMDTAMARSSESDPKAVGFTEATEQEQDLDSLYILPLNILPLVDGV